MKTHENASTTGGQLGSGGGLEVTFPPSGGDKSILKWILQTIEDELNEFVFNREDSFPGNWRNEFQAVWSDVEIRFQITHRSIDRLGPRSFAKGSKLEKAGLVGQPLKLKANRLGSIVRAFWDLFGGPKKYSLANPSAQVTALLEPRRTGVKDLLFGVINSLLGSLSRVFPPLEGIKEYKEHLEHAVKMRELGVES